jgi:hypothetical protein
MEVSVQGKEGEEEEFSDKFNRLSHVLTHRSSAMKQ